MEKLDIHEFLRIYLPGIFISFLAGRMLYGNSVDNASVATTAIFVGLTFSWMATRLSHIFFKKVASGNHFHVMPEASDFWKSWAHIVRNRAPESRSPITRKDVESITRAHYASRYGSPELYSFRIAKTFGVLYFSMAMAAALLCLLPTSSLLAGLPSGYQPVSFSEWTDLFALLLASSYFFVVARDYFIGSLRNELYYWVNIKDGISI